MRFIFLLILFLPIKLIVAQNDSIECLKQISIYRQLYKMNYKEQAYQSWQNTYQNYSSNKLRLCADGEKYLIENLQNHPSNKLILDSLIIIYDDIKKNTSNIALIELKQAIALFNYAGKSSENMIKTKNYFDMAYYQLNEKFPIQAFAPYYFTLEYLIQERIILAEEFFVKAIPIFLHSNSFSANESTKKMQESFVDFTNTQKDDFLASLAKLNIHQQSQIVIFLAETSFQLKKTNQKWLSPWLNSMPQDSLKKLPAETVSHLYFIQAGNYYELGQLINAKKLALQSIACKENPLSYILLGDIYILAAGQNPQLYDAAIYCLAADQFDKACHLNPALRDSTEKKIKWLHQCFPSQEDAFFKGIENNSVYQFGSWINESTKIRFKESCNN